MTGRLGFSLIELVIVLVLLSILSITAIPRLLDSQSELLITNRDQLVSVLRLMQQQAMQDTAGSCQTLLLQTQQVSPDTNAGCAAASSGSALLWQAPSGLSVSATVLSDNSSVSLPLSLEFSKLGAPLAYSNGIKLQLNGTDNTEIICIQAEGYIHPCA